MTNMCISSAEAVLQWLFRRLTNYQHNIIFIFTIWYEICQASCHGDMRNICKNLSGTNKYFPYPLKFALAYIEYSVYNYNLDPH